MQKIRTLGRLPRTNKKYGKEYALANQLRHAKKVKHLSASQLAELAQLPRTKPRDASQLAAHRMDALPAVYTERVHRCCYHATVYMTRGGSAA